MKEPWFHIVCELDSEAKPALTVNDIQRAVCGRFAGVSVHDILSERRSGDVTYPRQIAMHLAKTLTRKSYPAIAKAFGGMDHTTIIYGSKKIERLSKEDAWLRHLLSSIRNELGWQHEIQ